MSVGMKPRIYRAAPGIWILYYHKRGMFLSSVCVDTFRMFSAALKQLEREYKAGEVIW